MKSIEANIVRTPNDAEVEDLEQTPLEAETKVVFDENGDPVAIAEGFEDEEEDLEEERKRVPSRREIRARNRATNKQIQKKMKKFKEQRRFNKTDYGKHLKKLEKEILDAESKKSDKTTSP